MDSGLLAKQPFVYIDRKNQNQKEWNSFFSGWQVLSSFPLSAAWMKRPGAAAVTIWPGQEVRQECFHHIYADPDHLKAPSIKTGLIWGSGI
jgi:hypothetical protein